MEEKNVITRSRQRLRLREGAVIRIDEEAAQALEGLLEQCNMSVKNLASNLIKFAAERTVFKDPE